MDRAAPPNGRRRITISNNTPRAEARRKEFLKNTNYTVNFKSYNWGLNDQGSHGRSYSTPQFLLDKLF